VETGGHEDDLRRSATLFTAGDDAFMATVHAALARVGVTSEFALDLGIEASFESVDDARNLGQTFKFLHRAQAPSL
jgi:hypothetical protein